MGGATFNLQPLGLLGDAAMAVGPLKGECGCEYVRFCMSSTVLLIAAVTPPSLGSHAHTLAARPLWKARRWRRAQRWRPTWLRATWAQWCRWV